MKKNRKKSPKFIGSEIFNSHSYPFVEYFFYQFDQIKKKRLNLFCREKNPHGALQIEYLIELPKAAEEHLLFDEI